MTLTLHPGTLAVEPERLLWGAKRSRDISMLFRRTQPVTTTAEQEFEKEAMPHLDDLFRTLSRLTASQADAQDLVQEVYLQAWRSFDRYQRGTNCRAWLYSIMYNKLQHYRRSRATARVFPIADPDSDLLDNLAGDTFVPENITDTEVLEALDGIPEEFRDVVLLADVQEFAYKEIAEMMNIPIGTVMSRLSRARRMLRQRLAECAKNYGVRNTRQKENE
jgi:RNA polymerase sigma-70 factor, ECF subfamily